MPKFKLLYFVIIAKVFSFSQCSIIVFFACFQGLIKFLNGSKLHWCLLELHLVQIIFWILPNELQSLYLFIGEMQSFFCFPRVFHNFHSKLCFKDTLQQVISFITLLNAQDFELVIDNTYKK